MTRDLFMAEIRRALKDHDRGEELMRFAEANLPITAESDRLEWSLQPPNSTSDNAWGWKVLVNGLPLAEATSIHVASLMNGIFEITAKFRPKNVRIVRE